MNGVVFLILLAGLIVLGLFVLKNLQTIRKKRLIRMERRQLEREENILISRRAAKKLHHLLADDETQILWVDRRHWFTAWRVIVLAAAGTASAVTTIALAIWPLSVTLPSIGGSSGQSFRLSYLWVLPAAFTVAAFLVAWTLWLKWSSEYRLLTPKRLLLAVQPWEWAFWLWNTEKVDPLPLEAVTAVETKSTYWGSLYDFGSVVVKSLLQDSEDEEFHEITYMRKSHGFKTVIDQAVKDGKVKLVAVGASIVPVEEPG